MSMMRLRVWDVTGSRSQAVEAPQDIEIARLIVILVERMSLPINSPDGQIMVYKLHNKRTGQQLLDRQNLTEAGVMAGDDLRLQPEITAGALQGACLPRFPSDVDLKCTAANALIGGAF